MKKIQSYVIIALTCIAAIAAFVGTMNHYYKFYDVKPVKKPNNNGNNNNNNGNNNNNNGNNNGNNGNNGNGGNNGGGSKEDLNGYECQSESCNLAKDTTVISDKYEFVSDGKDIVLYDIKGETVIDKYADVEKHEDLYIVESSNGLYGVLKITDTISKIYETQYKAIRYNTKDNHFVITGNSSSYIADENGNKISSDYTADIIEYSDKYIVTRSSNGDYHIFNFNNKEYLTEYYNGKRLFIELIDTYVGVITNKYEYQVFDFTTSTRLVGYVKLEEGSTSARARKVGNQIEIYDGDNVLKTIDL